MVRHDVHIAEDSLAEFCRRHGVARLSLFGSILRADFRPGSDVDMLVEFLPGIQVSLFDMAAMQLDLSEMIGRQVDLRTPEDLSRYFRDRVLAEAQVQYAV